jgi:hypothetical protein
LTLDWDLTPTTKHRTTSIKEKDSNIKQKKSKINYNYCDDDDDNNDDDDDDDECEKDVSDNDDGLSTNVCGVLACGCSDGNLRIYDISLLTLSSLYISNDKNTEPAVLFPILTIKISEYPIKCLRYYPFASFTDSSKDDENNKEEENIHITSSHMVLVTSNSYIYLLSPFDYIHSLIPPQPLKISQSMCVSVDFVDRNRLALAFEDYTLRMVDLRDSGRMFSFGSRRFFS